MEKLKLKEKWEASDGWDFNDLCAVVACALGENFVLPGERKRAESLKAKLSRPFVKRIEAKAHPDIVHVAGEVVSLRPEVYQGYLILGLGHSQMPIDPALSDVDGLTKALADYMKVSVAKVAKGTFPRAKREVYNRYQHHLANQERRAEFVAMSPQNAERRGLPQSRLFDAVRLKMESGGLSHGPGSAGDDARMGEVFLKAGLKPPSRRQKDS